MKRGEEPVPSWNSEIAKPVERDLDSYWKSFKDACDLSNEASFAVVKNQLDTVRDKVHGTIPVM